MKLRKLIIAFPACMLLVTGCSNFFDTSSVSTLDASEVFNSPVRTEQAIQGVYELFGENNSYRNRMACGYIGFNTDIEHSTKSDAKSAPDDELMTYALKTSHKSVSSTNGTDIWSYLNSAIERSSNIIEGIEEFGDYTTSASEDAAKMRYYLGEAYFLRSFAYLEMVKIWGDVPARFVSLKKDADGLNAKKTDRNVIFDQLRIDLLKAADLMPWSAQIPVSEAANNVGRPSKAAALALLARMDLMYAGKAMRPDTWIDGGGSTCSVQYNIKDAAKRREVYQEALEACAQIIKNEDYKLAADFETPFQQICADEKKYDAMEHIWVIPFLNGARGQVLNYNAPKLPSASTSGDGSVAGHLPGYGNGGSSNGHITISPWLVYKYAKNDKRREVTVVPFQWYYDNGSTAVKNDTARVLAFLGKDSLEKCLYQKAASIDMFYCGKFRYEWMNQGRELVGTDDGVDFPIIRYADVLMMFAEASVGGISGDKPDNKTGLNPLSEFNKVRTRAGLSGVAELKMDTIMLERAKEFAGEYIRKWDLMRWGLLRKNVKDATDYLRAIARPSGRATENIGDTLYYKYKKITTPFEAYVLDSLYGLNVGETSAPAYYNKDNGWLKKNMYYSDSKDWLLDAANYIVYHEEEHLDLHQYWPIWGVNVKASPSTLWNDYGYPND